MILKILGGVYLLGLVGLLVGGVWLRRRAFAEGLGWGLLCTFVPGGSLVFLWRCWDDARDPFIASCLGFACVLPLVLSNPVRFAQTVSTSLARDGWRGVPLGTAFPPEPASFVKAKHDPWPIPVEEAVENEEAIAAEPEPTPAGPSDAFEREADIADRLEKRQREARAAFERHRAEAETLFKALNAHRARLKAEDARAVAAFNAEAARYAALLEQTRAERVVMDQVLAPITAPDPVAPAAPRPGAARRRAGGPNGVIPSQPTSLEVALAASAGGRKLTVGVATNRPGPVTNTAPDPYRNALDAARAAQTAASLAEEAGPWAADVYGTVTAAPAGGTAGRSPLPSSSPRR